MVPILPLPKAITHLSSQGMQGAKDFAEHLLGEAGAAALLQAPVTDARATKLSTSSHDTFGSHPHYHRAALTTPTPPSSALVAWLWCKNTASPLERGFEVDPFYVTDKHVHQSDASIALRCELGAINRSPSWARLVQCLQSWLEYWFAEGIVKSFLTLTCCLWVLIRGNLQLNRILFPNYELKF